MDYRPMVIVIDSENVLLKEDAKFSIEIQQIAFSKCTLDKFRLCMMVRCSDTEWRVACKSQLAVSKLAKTSSKTKKDDKI